MTDPAVNECPKTPIIIHVGYPKTGTTWLQKRVFPVLPDIDFWPDATFLEALLPNENNHGRIETVAFPWDNVGSRPVLISRESLLGNFMRGEVDHPGKDCFMIADRLHRMVKKAKIIITIRNQATMLDSLYRQYIHGGFRGDFDTVFASGRIPLGYLFYDKVISHYRKLFGAEAVYVGLFEEIQHQKEKFLSGLTGFMGVETPIFDPSVFSHRDNQGLSEFSLAALRVFNAVYPSSFPTQKWLHRWVRTADAKILLKLSPRRLNKLDDSMLDCYRPGNRALVEQLGLPLAEHGYPL